MNIKRANEIIQSPSNIEVEYNGHSVWLERVHDYTKTADIKDLQHNKKMEVDIERLNETGNIEIVSKS